MGTHLSKAKIEANQGNAKVSTGPANTISTRHNALKHGLLSQGVTELDEIDYHSLVRACTVTMNNWLRLEIRTTGSWLLL